MFKLTITSPNDVEYQGNVASLNITTQNGQITLLSNHSAFVDVVIPCEAMFRDENGEATTLVVSGGWLLVQNNEVTVYVNSSDFDYEIDINEAKELANQSESIMHSDAIDKIRYAQANAQFQKAVQLIKSYNKKNKS